MLNEYNFDHPDAFDIELMIDVLRKLKDGKKVEVPVYNFCSHSREINTVSVDFFVDSSKIKIED